MNDYQLLRYISSRLEEPDYFQSYIDDYLCKNDNLSQVEAVDEIGIELNGFINQHIVNSSADDFFNLLVKIERLYLDNIHTDRKKYLVFIYYFYQSWISEAWLDGFSEKFQWNIKLYEYVKSKLIECKKMLNKNDDANYVLNHLYRLYLWKTTKEYAYLLEKKSNKPSMYSWLWEFN